MILSKWFNWPAAPGHSAKMLNKRRVKRAKKVLAKDILQEARRLYAYVSMLRLFRAFLIKQNANP